MELRHLRYFVAVAEELNFSRAAQRLGIVQPALSRQIAALESAIGGRLFERSKRHVALTEAGRLLLDEAQAALAQVERVVSVGRNAVAGRAGLLSVAVSSTSMFNSQPSELLQRYRSDWPDVEIELHEMWTATQIAMLSTGRIDLGFQHIDSDLVGTGGGLERSGLQFEVLGSEGLVAALAVDHPLAHRKSVSLRDLADEAFFVLPQRFAEIGPFRRIERIRGAPLRVAQQVLNVPAMINLAAVGLGVAMVPQCMTSIRLPRIRYIPIAEEKNSRSLALVYPKAIRRQTARNLVELAKRSRRTTAGATRIRAA